MLEDDTDRKVAYAVAEDEGQGKVYDPNPDRKLDKLPTEKELQEFVEWITYSGCFSS